MTRREAVGLKPQYLLEQGGGRSPVAVPGQAVGEPVHGPRASAGATARAGAPFLQVAFQQGTDLVAPEQKLGLREEWLEHVDPDFEVPLVDGSGIPGEGRLLRTALRMGQGQDEPLVV